ncbi:hypothetical protein [Noviluteimonas gilva]|uniref:Uncharacterized protein n=1 Tax=Noviluteimonas gilva TaxID=2682097 RepID=A0A7C9I5Y4_9GAMM|nr:hypothetical protein [Lysobacter gilvus]MUV14689.1 hypothetical protein [Lysobacter gilvus]
MTSAHAHELRSCLVEVGERTYSQLVELFKDIIVRQLQVASTVCRRIGIELTRGDLLVGYSPGGENGQ